MGYQFRPRMNRDVLINGYMHVLKTIYSPDYYYERVQRFFKEYHPPKSQASRIEFNYFISLIKAFWIMGIIENDRKLFWKFLIFTLFKNPRFFWQAMRYSMYHRHFLQTYSEAN